MGKGGRVVFNYMLTRGNSRPPSLERLAGLMNRLDLPAEMRFTGYTDIGYDTGIRTFTGDAFSTSSLVRQMQGSCPGWDIRYSTLTGYGKASPCPVPVCSPFSRPLSTACSIRIC